MSFSSSSSCTYFLIILLTFLITRTTSRLVSEDVVIVEQKLESPSDASSSVESECEVHANPSLHKIMDRVCEICHDMISHREPNMRAICRSDCFKNDQFRSCLRMFSPHRQTRHHHKF